MMLIRPARDDDFGAIADLVNHYILHTTVHFGGTPQPADELRAAWRATREAYPFLVARGDADEFLGFAKGSRWREREAYARTVETGIYVSRHAQGRGVGRRLYDALLVACRDSGYHAAVGGITMPNEPSVRLHRACGFELVGIFREVGWKFNAWHDVAWYQRRL